MTKDINQPTTQPYVKIIPGEQLLKHTFTPEEKAQMSEELVGALAVQTGVADELATIKSQYKTKEAEASARVNMLANKLRTGYEVRTIRIEKHLDIDKGAVTIFRVDTGEVVSVRELYDSERQLVLEVGRESATDMLERAE